MTDDSDRLEDELAEIAAMFVQTAAKMTSDGETITFDGLSPATLFVSDRPQRIVGHMTTRQFVEIWGAGQNSFAADPPNAVISFLGDEGVAPEDVIVVLKDPGLEGGRLTYTVVVLEGSLPADATCCSVFIDPFGESPSKVSVSAVNQQRRRP